MWITIFIASNLPQRYWGWSLFKSQCDMFYSKKSKLVFVITVTLANTSALNTLLVYLPEHEGKHWIISLLCENTEAATWQCEERAKSAERVACKVVRLWVMFEQVWSRNISRWCMWCTGALCHLWHGNTALLSDELLCASKPWISFICTALC